MVILQKMNTLAAPKINRILQIKYTRRMPIQTRKKMNIMLVILTTSSSSLGGKLDCPSLDSALLTTPQKATVCFSSVMIIYSLTKPPIGLYNFNSPPLASSSLNSFRMWVTTWERNSRCTNEMAIGMILKADKARVVTPIVMPPRRRLTQQQHLLTQGILANFFTSSTSRRLSYSWWSQEVGEAETLRWLPAQLWGSARLAFFGRGLTNLWAS